MDLDVQPYLVSTVTAEALRTKIDWKSAFCKGWSVSTKFSRRRGRPHQSLIHE